MTVGDLLEMSSREYLSWVEYHSRIPFTAERQDLLMANLLALTCNINRGKDTKPVDAFDFLPWLPKQVKVVKMNDPVINKNLVAGKDLFKQQLKRKVT
jgi:hypothetical protein